MIYMDHNATTPVHPKVVEAMLPFLWEHYGNPSSAHQMGAVVRDAVEKARASVASLIGAKPEEIYFTSGATEANNLAIRGFLSVKPYWHVLTSGIEHHATLRTCEAHDWPSPTMRIPVDERGQLVLDELRKTLEYIDMPALVCVMHANNETGNMLDIKRISGIVNNWEGMIHVDAAQTFGKVPIDVDQLAVDMLSISGHKIYAPKGIGALYVREGVKLEAQITGGHQERDLRAGTENVPGIIGLGKAAELAAQDTIHRYAVAKAEMVEFIDSLRNHMAFYQVSRDTTKLQEGLSAIDGAKFNSYQEINVGNTVNVSFEGVDGEALVLLLDQQDICVSHGAACESGLPEPSHVLKAMGRTDEEASGAIRISLGIYNTIFEVEEVVSAITEIVTEIRS